MSPLTINLTNGPVLVLDGPDDEVGPVTINGSTTGFRTQGEIDLSSLNQADGNSVTFEHVGVITGSPTAAAGPVSLVGSYLQVGQASSPAGAMTVHGGLVFDSASELALAIDAPGGTAGDQYSQLTVNGPIDLGGATFEPFGAGTCPALPIGMTETLISTSATLAGTFAAVPNGTDMRMSCAGTTPPWLQITYTTNSVIATVVAAPTSTPTSPTGSEPPSSMTASPKLTAVRLRGLARGRPTLSLTLAAGTGTAGIRTVRIAPPRGLRFTVVRTTLARGVRIVGATGRVTRLASGAVLVTLSNPAPHLTVAVSWPGLTETHHLQRAARRAERRRDSARETVRVQTTDATGQSWKPVANVRGT